MNDEDHVKHVLNSFRIIPLDGPHEKLTVAINGFLMSRHMIIMKTELSIRFSEDLLVDPTVDC